MITYGARILGVLCLGAFALALGAGTLTAPSLAVALACLPLVIFAMAFPQPFLVAAVAMLPFSTDIAGGRLGGAQVAASDVLLALGSLGLAASLLGRRGPHPVASPLRPIAVPVVLYFCALGLSVLFHPTAQGVITFVQRLELVVVALLAGSLLAQRGLLKRALVLQVIAASVLAAAAIGVAVVQGAAAGEFLGIQKNFAGQAIAVALLVVVSYRVGPARPGFAGLLAVGVMATLSRGAIIAAGAALLVMAASQAPGRRLRQLGAVLAVGTLVLVTYSTLPDIQQERLIQVSPEEDYGSRARVLYADDAWATFESAPVLGVGAGNYAGGNALAGVTDPHNVVLLEAADGGVVLAGAFVVLIVGSFVALFRRIRRHPLVLTAVAVQTATVLHGMVDIYWVRGTPVLGWVLVGAALTLAQRPEEGAATEPREREGSPRWS